MGHTEYRHSLHKTEIKYLFNPGVPKIFCAPTPQRGGGDVDANPLTKLNIFTTGWTTLMWFFVVYITEILLLNNTKYFTVAPPSGE